VFEKVRLEEDRFGFESEIVGKVARLRYRTYEVGRCWKGRMEAAASGTRAVEQQVR